MQEEFQTTLKKLKVSKIDSLLFHNPNDLKNVSYKYVLDWLEDLKSKNLLERIGLSIYEYNDLEKISLDQFQIIQIPFSIYDQRPLNNGIIEELKKNKISIHARSIFLQGLILQDCKLWPDFLSEGFKFHHEKYLRKFKFLKKRYSRGNDEITFFIDDFEAVTIGISSFEEFNQILDIYEKLSKEILFDPKIFLL